MTRTGKLTPILISLFFCFFSSTIYQSRRLTTNATVKDQTDKKNTNNKDEKKNGSESKVKERPVIYTFFELRKNENGKHVKEDEERHDLNMLSTWKQLWEDAGWETRVLTLKDAKKHKDFEYFSKALLSSPLDPKKQKFYGGIYPESYNYLCFMRWLAMASHGNGGFMSDYDTIPMGINPGIGLFLPSYGAFTSYDRHIPSLLSGTGEEWERMSKLVLKKGVDEIKSNHGQGNSKRRIYSDMLALKDIHTDSPMEYIQQPRTYLGLPYLKKNEVDCDGLKLLYVVHLSHHLCKQAVKEKLLDTPKGKYGNWLRPGWARELTQHWKEQCHQKEIKKRA